MMEERVDQRDEVLVAIDTMAREHGMSLQETITVVARAISELGITIKELWEENREEIQGLATIYEEYTEIDLDEPKEPWRPVMAIKPTKNHREIRRIYRRQSR